MLVYRKVYSFFWKERMIYSNKHRAYFPDFSLVTHNQRQCFQEHETHIDPKHVQITFINQISGLINNSLIKYDFLYFLNNLIPLTLSIEKETELSNFSKPSV